MSINQSIQASVAHPSSDLLGEGPVWNEERGSLLWVDIEGQLLHEMKWPEKEIRSWSMPQMIGMVALVNKNSVIVALQDGVAGFDLAKNELTMLAHLEKEIKSNRPNDGKCDPGGRLWLGTMNLNCEANAGSLYCIDRQLSVTKKISSLTISNGMAWTPDNRRFYFTDSITYKVDSYLFDPESGNAVFEKTAIIIDGDMGMPDGMTIDEEGMLWIAHWNGFAVRRWDPLTGKLLDTIELPVPLVTSCSFGGNNLDELFITTAKTGLSDEQLKQYPFSGNLFIAKLRVKGILPGKFILSS
jgi:sugar lactone lactonase YvrE